MMDFEIVDESGLMVSSTSGATKPVVFPSLPAAVHAVAYSMPLGSGGLPPYTCTIGGTLPTGITLTSSTCTIAGTTASTGSFSLGTVSITDSNSLNATGSLSLTVN